MHGEFAPGQTLQNERGEVEVTLRSLTTHNKWSIHSQYFDNLQDAFRKHGMKDLDERQDRQRGVLGRLNHHGIPHA